MVAVVWDALADRVFETGVDHGVLYIPDGTGAYNTGVAWNGDLLDGTLTTPNRRGEEKAIRLRELVAERQDGETFAYGNSASDLPHLRIARHGLLVNGSLAARREAATVGVPTAEWT